MTTVYLGIALAAEVAQTGAPPASRRFAIEYLVDGRAGLSPGLVGHLVFATSAHPPPGPGSGSAAGSSSQPEAPGANRLRASCKRLSGESAPAPALPNLPRSGHQAAAIP
jgi:hypothetical protein